VATLVARLQLRAPRRAAFVESSFPALCTLQEGERCLDEVEVLTSVERAVYEALSLRPHKLRDDIRGKRPNQSIDLCSCREAILHGGPRRDDHLLLQGRVRQPKKSHSRSQIRQMFQAPRSLSSASSPRSVGRSVGRERRTHDPERVQGV
jgi:hypothetical protein